MIDIQPQYLSLAGLFNQRLFEIPGYQRAYSWTTKQRSDLFNDINKTFSKGPDEGHFMAATVCLQRRKTILGTDQYTVLEIVDGQQRLTTLVLLMKAISIAARGRRKAEKISTEIDHLLVKEDGDELLLLQTNHDSSHHFSNYVRHGKRAKSKEATTIADRELLKAIEECTAFVEQWITGGKKLSALLSLIKNRLFFLLHEISEEKAVYTVFEVLNSRGLSVSWLDRLKSILMGAAFEQKPDSKKAILRDLHVVWREVYSCIGLHQGLNSESLRFAGTLRTRVEPSRPLSEEDSVNVLRDQATTFKKIREVADWVLLVTKACDRIFADPRIGGVTRIVQVRLLAVAILLREDIKDKKKEELLKIWEKVTFRMYGMAGNDGRTGVGDFTRLAWRTINENLSPAKIIAELKSIGSAYPIREAVRELTNEDCYNGWGDELRYFMFRYEEYLSREFGLNFKSEQWAKVWMSSPADSIEHILPQSKAGAKTKDRLGNLVILPPRLNSKLNADPPKEKVDAYRKTGLLIASEAADDIDRHGTWRKKQIEEREKRLIDWAIKEWGD